MTSPYPPEKIKVCIVAISLGSGGAERSCAMLSQMLEEQGFDVHLAILNDRIDYPYSGTLLNLGKDKKEGDGVMSRLQRLKRLKEYLHNENIDIVIDQRAKNNIGREWLYRTYVYKGIKTIYVVRSYRKQTYFGQKPERMARLYRSNIKNVAVSEAIAQTMKTELKLPNVVTIYNSFDPNRSGNSELPSEVPDGKFILSYGRLDDEVKDFGFLLNAYSASKLWEDGVTLVIMGEGKDKEKLKTLAETLEIGSHVRFLPFTKDPFPVIEKAHMVTLTSRFEGFPRVLLESLSVGTPVVSLDITSGPSEIVRNEENGLLISKREVPLFAKGLRRMVEDENLYNHCAAQARKSLEPFSWETVARQWKEVITL